MLLRHFAHKAHNKRRRDINSVIEKAKPIITAVLDELGYELVDLEYKTLYGDKHLIVYIAHEGGVSLDDCENVSNALDAPLDALDPTGNSPYCLDVSSPGLDRPFKTRRDYERNLGEPVEIKLYAPLNQNSKDKFVVGKLVGYDDDVVTVDVGGEITAIPHASIALARPYIEFS